MHGHLPLLFRENIHARARRGITLLLARGDVSVLGRAPNWRGACRFSFLCRTGFGIGSETPTVPILRDDNWNEVRARSRFMAEPRPLLPSFQSNERVTFSLTLEIAGLSNDRLLFDAAYTRKSATIFVAQFAICQFAIWLDSLNYLFRF